MRLKLFERKLRKEIRTRKSNEERGEIRIEENRSKLKNKWIKKRYG